MRQGCGSASWPVSTSDDVNLRARMVRVLGKGGKERLVPFNGTTAKAIRDYLPGSRSDLASTAAPGGGLQTATGRTGSPCS